MPGLIDAHWHAFMAATPQILLMTADSSYPRIFICWLRDKLKPRGFSLRFHGRWPGR
jgi:hypothetical protein